MQKIVDDDYPDWEWDNPDDGDIDRELLSMIIGVSVEGNTKKQDRELEKEAKKIWREIG